MGFNRLTFDGDSQEIYKILDWDKEETLFYSMGGFGVLVMGFLVGWIFSRIITKNHRAEMKPVKSNQVAPENPEIVDKTDVRQAKS